MSTIQPPFTLHTLRVVKDSMGSPRQPAVVIVQEEVPDGRWLGNHVLTPEQAATLAADLNAAAGMPPSTDFDRDPAALAWARAGVQRFVDKMRAFARQATETGTTDPMQWRKIANLVEREFIGGHGCIIATFDERRPTLPVVTP